MTNALPPEAYALYDRYCHGDIDRRAFFDGLGRLSVGGLGAAAMAAALLPNYALAQQVDPNDPAIRTERFAFKSPQGAGDMQGLLAMPSGDAKVPAVLVVHENRGLNPYIEDVARRLAKAGYIALAPDALYPLGGYPGNDDDGRAMQRERERDEMLEDFIAGAEAVRGHARSTGRLGAVGFCFGGWVVNEMAVRMESLDAAVPYYGGWPDASAAKNLNAPLMVQLAGLDDRVNAGWPDYEAALIEAGKTYSVHHYEGVNHGFHNDSTSRFDEAAASLSWDRTLDLFGHYLS
ncbi:MAG: dienelactone hydrolase family protein [Parvularcula sp.]|jgi:carboxymethylenebutenolidase|nr:dienelactone hydrolase family protein [Parvularcula sp.]